MKKSLLALGIVSLLGTGLFTANASADNANLDDTAVVSQQNNNFRQRNKNDMCSNLTEEQKSLIEKGYNELTQEEKSMYDKYRGQSKRDLSEEQLNEYYKIQDKVHKYMDEDFKAQMKKRREERQTYREERQNNRGQGKGACRQ